MTAVTTGRMSTRASEEPPRSPNWEKIGVILAILTQLGGAVWFASSVDQRIASLEAQLPAGAIARLDQHVVDLDRTIGQLQATR
jgi:hypothetical protein